MALTLPSITILGFCCWSICLCHIWSIYISYVEICIPSLSHIDQYSWIDFWTSLTHIQWNIFSVMNISFKWAWTIFYAKGLLDIKTNFMISLRSNIYILYFPECSSNINELRGSYQMKCVENYLIFMFFKYLLFVHVLWPNNCQAKWVMLWDKNILVKIFLKILLANIMSITDNEIQ